MIRNLLFTTAFVFAGVAANAQCLDWVDPTPTTPWTDFDPVPCMDGEFQEITAFEVFKSEAYLLEGIYTGGSYTFSVCNQSDTTEIWVPEFTVIAPSGAVDNFGAGDGDGCSITWTATETGDYTLVINEAGACGVAGASPGGYPRITTNSGGVCCEFPMLTGATVICGEDDGYSVELTFGSTPVDGSYSIVNNKGVAAVPMDADGTFTVGPFGNDTVVLFSVENIGTAECEPLVLGTIVGNCTDPCLTAGSTTYEWNTVTPQIGLQEDLPTPDGDGNCGSVTFTGFEIWGGEAYSFVDMPANTAYSFDVCTGTGANTYAVNLSVIDASGNEVASTQDFDCSISWSTTTAGTYTVVTSRVGYCGIEQQIDNGNPTITCEGTVGLSELQSVEAKIFPNPVVGELSISTSLEGRATVRIFDAIGRQVANEVLTLNGATFIQNVANLENGVYTLQIMTEDKVATERFLKQ